MNFAVLLPASGTEHISFDQIPLFVVTASQSNKREVSGYFQDKTSSPSETPKYINQNKISSSKPRYPFIQMESAKIQPLTL